MSGSNWRARVTTLETFFCILAVAGTLVIVYTTGGADGVIAGRNEVTAREHYEREKQNALGACFGREGPAAIECATKAIETAQDKSETRQDLYAQQDMAEWARWMWIIRAFTAGITAVGVWFVRRTLEATLEAVEDTSAATLAMQKQNEISKDATNRQLRAYLEVSECIVSVFPDDGEIIMQIRLKNCGQTPANDVRVMAESFAAPFPLDNERPFLPVDKEWGSSLGPGLETGCVKRIRTHNVEWAVQEAKARRGAFYIQGICEYLDCFGESHDTHFRYAFAGLVSDNGLLMQPCKTGNHST
ncbi:hypothetical protein [Sphingosinicella soli]|uniref:Uncharacterized protein n=1 Tax=Sphingosinicella soli TaxID=333708 RepID=A0A7W7B621_9SPHN|nr:hypothetical protein [Sphingosinicella soli]MBB4633828.1 hypothetical protein [Sphingosinicella soli]